MQKQSNSRSWKCFPTTLAMLCPLLLLSTFTLILLLITSNISYYPSQYFHFQKDVCSQGQIHTQISTLQAQMGSLLQQLHSHHDSKRNLSTFSDQLLHMAVSLDKIAGSLSNPPDAISSSSSSTNTEMMSQVDEDFSEPGDDEENEEESIGVKGFTSGSELYNYISPKSNREKGKKNFLGVEAISPGLGLGCTHLAAHLEHFMKYKKYGMCPDDWDVAQRLMINGCDPLPRRKCFSRASPTYSPFSNSSSLWTQQSDGNILWNRYKCKDYACLVSQQSMDKRGFFKCGDCFNLTKRGWDVTTTMSAEFTIDQVLGLRPGEIRIGLDFSPTTGTFAAIMKERGVTVASATLNLGAPFNEVIALRGLLPLYISVGTRLPFFDNTLDIVHSTLFLDGWIGVELLQFVLFDWDRVLRPKGLLWVDRFFCKKQDMKLYLDEFERLGYKKLLWRLVPKTDKLGDELFLSAVLEKPIRK
ncbi:Probable methyltransferase At1g29790 [Linum grandiflorum]